MKKHSSHTSFRITGDFDCKEICNLLKITPHKIWDKNDIRSYDGKKYRFSNIEICYTDEFDMIVSNQIEKAIAPLLQKTELLNKLREQFNLNYSVCVGVEIAFITKGDYSIPTPCLSPSLKVMDFCTTVRADLDIDYYII